MDVLVIKNKELQLYNTFIYKSAEDFIYFALFVCEQLDLDPDQLDCCFFGEIEKTHTLIIWLTNTFVIFVLLNEMRRLF